MIEDSLIWAKLRGLSPVARMLSDEETVDLNLEFLLTGCAQNSCRVHNEMSKVA